MSGSHVLILHRIQMNKIPFSYIDSKDHITRQFEKVINKSVGELNRPDEVNPTSTLQQISSFPMAPPRTQYSMQNSRSEPLTPVKRIIKMPPKNVNLV